MSPEVIDLILKKLEDIENEIKSLNAFKNQIIGYGIALSAVFAFVFDWLKNLFKG